MGIFSRAVVVTILQGLVLSQAIGCGGQEEISSAPNAEAAPEDAGQPDVAPPSDAVGDSVERDDADTADVDAEEGDRADAAEDVVEPREDLEEFGLQPIESVGCGGEQVLTEGEQAFVLEELERRYIVRLPENYDHGKPWPLVLALHANNRGAEYWDLTGGGRNIRGVLAQEAVLIIAEAIDGHWRDYDTPSESWPARLEQELRYFDKVIGDARTGLCLDETAIFSMGFSGGGSFSGVLGCRRDDIRAIVAGGSVVYFDQADCVGRPSAWITIGDFEFNEGRAAFRDFFRTHAGCEEASVLVQPDPCVSFDGCAQGLAVHYCQHISAHVWPNFASEAMWAFFEQFVDMR